MNAIISIFIFIFGAIIGSFLNVVVYRYNTGRGLGGRSFCNSCGKTLRWFELIPVISYLWIRGHCRHCKENISAQYMLVELGTGLLFVGAYNMIGTFLPFMTPLQYVELVYLWIQISLLVVIFVYDMRHKIIPDLLVFTFAALALAHAFLNGASALDLWAGPILFTPFFLMWFLSRGTWMGFGDAKLALGIGWFLGLALGGTAIVFGFWIGAVFAIGLLILQKTKYGMRSEIAFGPFLILGLLLVLFFHFNLFSYLTI